MESNLRAALISLGSKSSKMTAESMGKYFGTVDMLNIKEIDVTFGSADEKAQVVHKGKPIGEYDCVFVKGSFNYSSIARAITTFFEGKSYMPFQKDAFTVVHDKLLTHMQFEKARIPSPLTYLSSTSIAAKEILKQIPYPIILKFPQGTHGKGVMVADSYAAASSILDALDTLNQPCLIQEYIETAGADIRAMVIGDKVVAAMKRIAKGDEKRSNLHAGGTSEPCTLDAKYKKIAVDTARALGLDIAGVDILEGPKGPLVIEANVSPGLQGITNATGIDIADLIAKFLYEKTIAYNESKQAAKPTADELLRELSDVSEQSSDEPAVTQQIISNLDFRGDRILLPQVLTKMSGFTEEEELVLEVGRKSIMIRKS